jgi:hypothetical protein
MVINEMNQLYVPRCLSSLLPASVLSANQYFGSFIRFNCGGLGGKSLELRIYLADWVFNQDELELADCEGQPGENNDKLVILEGEKLLSIKAETVKELVFNFTNQFSLKVFANLDEYDFGDDLIIAYVDDILVKYSPAAGFTEGSIRG